MILQNLDSIILKLEALKTELAQARADLKVELEAKDSSLSLLQDENAKLVSRNDDQAATILELEAELAKLKGETGTAPEPTLPPQKESFLYYSTKPDRSDPQPLGGAVLSGIVYVFASGQGVQRAVFTLDNKPFATENRAPFDMGGTADDGTARPLDTRTLQNGEHTVDLSATTPNGLLTEGAVLEVDNPKAQSLYDQKSQVEASRERVERWLNEPSLRANKYYDPVWAFRSGYVYEMRVHGLRALTSVIAFYQATHSAVAKAVLGEAVTAFVGSARPKWPVSGSAEAFKRTYTDFAQPYHADGTSYEHKHLDVHPLEQTHYLAVAGALALTAQLIGRDGDADAILDTLILKSWLPKWLSRPMEGFVYEGVPFVKGAGASPCVSFAAGCAMLAKAMGARAEAQTFAAAAAAMDAWLEDAVLFSAKNPAGGWYYQDTPSGDGLMFAWGMPTDATSPEWKRQAANYWLYTDEIISKLILLELFGVGDVRGKLKAMSNTAAHKLIPPGRLAALASEHDVATYRDIGADTPTAIYYPGKPGETMPETNSYRNGLSAKQAAVSGLWLLAKYGNADAILDTAFGLSKWIPDKQTTGTFPHAVQAEIAHVVAKGDEA